MPQVTLKGNPVQLTGPELKAGERAPDFTLQSSGLEDVTLQSTSGKVRIIATVPSLDTSTCHMETKRFNEEAAGMPNVDVLVVSTDLPFGQKRWCGAEGVDKVKTLSDHRTVEFGKKYGVLVTGGPLERCLTRAIFVLGPDDVLRHVEYCSEISQHPNYDAALSAARG